MQYLAENIYSIVEID